MIFVPTREVVLGDESTAGTEGTEVPEGDADMEPPFAAAEVVDEVV